LPRPRSAPEAPDTPAHDSTHSQLTTPQEHADGIKLRIPTSTARYLCLTTFNSRSIAGVSRIK